MKGPIEEALREKFFPALFGGEDINADFRQILFRSIKHGSLCIRTPACQRRVHTTPPKRLVGNW